VLEPIVVLAWSLGSTPAVAQAQTPDSLRTLRWQHAAAALSFVVVASVADQPLKTYTQDNQTEFKSDVASAFRHMGQPEVFATVGLGTLGFGLVTGNGRVARAGGRITASLLLAGAVTTGIKYVVGRVRPSGSDNAYIFHPFTSDASFPSGHTTMAFALAASVSDEIRRTWATATLYSAAGLCAWSRIYNNEHWFSDVLAGAAVGITSAKLVNGRWQIFHLRPPAVLREPGGGVALLWAGTF
jgi:membrane-associated phospholipid phosphatase